MAGNVPHMEMVNESQAEMARSAARIVSVDELRRRSVADAQDASSSHSVALIKAMSPPYEP